MKNTLLMLLALAFVPLAHAAPLYRCDMRSGEVSYQDRPCMEVAHASKTSLEQFAAGEDDWNRPQDRQRRRQAVVAGRAETLRQKRLFNPAVGHRDAVYAASRRRCEDALNVAAFCGRRAGTFFCDEQGFRILPAEEVDFISSRAFRRASNYTIDQCELQAKAGG